MKKLALIFGVLLAFCISAKAQSLSGNGGKMCNGNTSITCGETINFYDDGGNGSGSSYNHGKGKNYYHTITSPIGTKIKITFSSLDIRGTSSSPSYLHIHNGTTTSDPVSDITNPGSFTSMGNVILVNFHSPASSGWSGYTAGSGWVATITVEECPSTLGSVSLACGADAITIGGDAINASTTAYTADQHCVRTYTTSLGTKFFLTFTDLPDDGTNDWVAVYDGPNTSSTLVGQYDASSSLASITSTTNALTIVFKSNSSVNGSWAATLQPDLCLEDLTTVNLDCGDTRVLGGTYTANMFTRQTFIANNADAQLLLDLSSIPHDNDNDYIEVYDGSGATATLIGQYFGYGTPSTIATTGNVMTVVFRSNATNNGSWQGVVTVDCPDVITMPGPGGGHPTYTTCNAMVYDNGGPTGNYSNNLNDEYIVLRPGRSGCVLRLEGEFTFDWQNDWITIYDGIGVDGDTLWGGGHHGHGYPRATANHQNAGNPSQACVDCTNCLSTIPNASATGATLNNRIINDGITCVTYYPKVTSKSGAITIRFHTNGSQNCAGFSFHVSCVPKPTDCYNTGVVIFSEDFGGNKTTDPLYSTSGISADVCSYSMTSNAGMTQNGGHYVLRKNACDEWQYFNYIDDHTHPGNIDQGYLFNIDASSQTGFFYKDKIDLDCDGVDKLLVSFWVANVNNQYHTTTNYPNLLVGFYSNQACTEELASVSTGPVPEMTMYGCTSDANEWQYYSLELPSVPDGLRTIWFQVANQTNTDNGNDFVLDDVEVRACLPPSILTRISGGQEIFSSANICAGDTLVLRANLDYSLGAQSTYSTPYYLWQRGVMTDADTIQWTNMNFSFGEWEVGGVTWARTNTDDIGYDAQGHPINDENNADGWFNYSEITIIEPPSDTEPTYSNHYYRVIIAGTPGALNSRYCHSSSDPYVVTVTRIPEIKFGGTNAICEGGTINLSVTNDSPTPGYWSIYSETEGSHENVQAPFHATITQDASGYHVTGALHDRITVQYQTSAVNGGCWNRKEIPIYTLPNITITPEISTICEGSEITLLAESNQTSTFQWGGGGPAGATWTVNPVVTTTYTVTVTTPHEIPAESGSGTEILNCISNANKVVTVLDKPGNITVAGAPTGPVCPGTELTFVPSATGAGTLTYSWDGTNYYTSAQPGSTYTVTATTPGTATYTLYVKDNRTEGGIDYSCPATYDVIVNVYNNPSLSISTPVDINCFGQNTGSFTLTGSSTGTSIAYGSGTTADPYYYEFSNDNGANFTHATTGNMLQYTFSDLYSGTYQVAIRDGHGCVFKDVVYISETQTAALTPIFETGNVLETCTDQSVGNATVSVSGGTTAYTYAWNTVDAPHWTVDSTRQTIENLAAGDYRVTVTDAHSCEATATVSITPRPVPNITASTTADAVCLSASTSTFSVLNGNNPPVASHLWSVTPTDGAGMPANLTTASLTVTPTASATSPVTYTYTDVVTAENGCVVSGTVSLTVNPTVILDHTSGDLDQTLCFEKTLVPIVFEYSGGASGVTLTWDDPAPATTCLDYAINTTAHTLTISEGTAPVAGTYRYTVQATGAISPCSNPTYTGMIIIRPELNVNVTGDHQACETGNIGVATAHPSGGRPFDTPDTHYNYAWNTTETTATINNLAGGTYSVTVTDANTCTATASTIIESKTNPTISISSTNVNCFGETTGSIEVTVTNHGTTAGTSNPYTNGPASQPNYYVFSTDNGTNTVNSSGEHYEQHTFAVSTQGNETSYTYNIYVRDGNDCTASQDVEITQPSLLTAAINPSDTIATCEGQSVGAALVRPAGGTQATAPAPAYTYAWNTVAAPHWTADSTRQRIENLAAGNYIVTVTDAHNCVATATVEIIPRPVPSINASTNAADVCASSPSATLSVMNNNSLPIASHSWSVDETTGAGLPSDLTTESLSVTPSGTSTTASTTYVYTDVVTAQNGCVVSGTVSLTVNPTLTLSEPTNLNQTLCFEKTLTPIVFEYGGGATGIALTWIGTAPASSCLSYTVDNAAQTLTISEGSSPVAGTYRYIVQATGSISPCTNPSYNGEITIRPELTVTVTADHESCATGAIGVATANPVGGKPFGTAPDTYYQYSWNTTPERTTQTIDNLPGGTYAVVVTDANGCTATDSESIVENTNPVVAIADVSTLCPEIGTTSVEASITTATTPNYIYRWTNDGAFAVTTTNPITTTATSVTVTASVPNIESAGCSNTYTLRLQVEDANNCLSNLAEKVITVEDVTAPVLTTPNTWPDNIIGQNNCFANADTTGLKNANEIRALYSDCSNITVTVSDAPTATSNCGWTWTRTYTIKDACGNTVNPAPTMSVSGSDQTAPVPTATWPDNISNQDNCFANADTTGLKDANEIKALFNDCSNITVTVSDVATANSNCNWTWTRTYTITDACGNIYYTSGTTKPTMSVSGSDQSAPTRTGTWPNNIIEQNNCFANADTTGLKDAGEIKALYSDCDNITVTVSDEATATSNCDWTWTRTYTIKDACGNTVTPAPTMSVSGSDQSAPALIATWPDNIIEQNNCFANADTTGLKNAGEIKALYSDCDNITVTVSDEATATSNCDWTWTRTYTIKDACGNTVTPAPTMSVSGSDQSAPALTTTWPDNITGNNSCFAEADTTGLLDAEEVLALYDDCDIITVTESDVPTSSDNCGWTWTRTYTIKDACGNTVTPAPTMSVSGSDLKAPDLCCRCALPDNIENQNNCFANADTTGLLDAHEMRALYEDCDNITVTVADEATATSNCGWTWTRTYTIKDECNNTVEPAPTMSVSGKDQNPPTYVVPPTLTVYKTAACTFVADTAVTHSVPTSLSDDCSAAADLTLTYTDSGVITATCTDTIKRTWRLVDACGNVSVVDSVQLILITDTIKPTITRNVDAQPALGVGSCQYEIPDLTGFVTVNDNCTAVADLVITQDPIAGTPTNMNREVTITVADKCGNTRSTTILVEYPSDISVQANPPIICKGQSTTLTVYSGGISTFYNYVWDNGLDATMNTPDNTNTVTVTPESTTTYHVDITNDNNCTQGANITVEVRPLPVVTFPDLGVVCPNVGTQEVVANIEATTPDYTYTWTSDLTLNGTATGTQNGTAFTITAVVPNDYNNNPGNCDRSNWIKLHVTDNDALHCEYEESYTIVIRDDVAPQLITAGSFPTGQDNMNVCYADRPTATPDDDIKALFTDNCSDFNVSHTTTESGDNCAWTVRYTYTITDLCDNTVTPAPYIEYTGGDTENPTITCPGNYSLRADSDHNYATLTIPVPVTDDNCEVASVVNDFNSTDDASGHYPLGTTHVIYTVTDGCGHSVECSFDVVVADSTPPCIGCDPDDPTDPFNPTDPNGITCTSIVASMGGNIVVYTSNDHNYYEHDNTGVHGNWDITYNDNSTAHAQVLVSCTLSGATTATVTTLDGQQFGIGTTRVRWRVEDQFGNADSCDFNVEVLDTTPPCIGCDHEDPTDPFNPSDPDGITCASIITSMGGSIEVYTSNDHNYYEHSNTGEHGNWNITYNDNSTDYSQITVFCVLSGETTGTVTTLDGQHFELGSTHVVWHVADEYGNEDSCSFDVMVRDTTPPCIGCDPEDPNDPFNPNDPDGRSCASIAPNVSHTIEVATSLNQDYYEHDNTGEHGNWNITYNDNSTEYANIIVTCVLSGATSATVTTLHGQHFELGTTHVVWYVEDQFGNVDSCDFYVEVSDTTPPCIGCDPLDPIDPFNPDDPQGVSCATIAGVDGGTIELGTSENVDYYEHLGNTWNITYNDNVGIASAVCNLSGATNATGLTTLANQHFEIGQTLVTWVVTDINGNEATCTFLVIVTDDQPPCIGCDPNDPVNPFTPVNPDDPNSPPNGVSCLSITAFSGSVNVNTMPGQTYYQHSDNSWNVTVNDNSGIASLVYSLYGATTVVNGSNESLNGQRFNIGATTVMWVATDIYGLTDTCIFVVNVTDIEPPTISCPDAIGNIACIDDVPPAYATYAQFTAAGGSAYDANGVDQSSFALLSQTSDGNTCPEVITRTYQIADIAGNTQTCTQTITINDTIVPLISGVQPTLNVGQGQNCEYPLPDFTSVVRAMSTDNCTPVSELTITQTPAAGNATMISSNTDVTIYVSDACGNTSQIIGHAVVPLPLEHTVSFSEILCAGQTSVVTIGVVDGTGTAPYNGIGQIVEPAGTYNYTVSDVNGCTSDFEVVIPQPQLLQTEIPDTGVLDVACYGQRTGYASVSVLGGTPGYTFAWSTTPIQRTQRAVNLAAGGYTVTVTDIKGCTSTSAVTIAQPAAALSASFAATDVTPVACYGEATGSATITVAGGTTPYEYSWNTSPVQTTATASNLVAGNYTVTITDAHGCTLTKPVTISGQSSLLTSSFVNGSVHDVNCFGQATGSATVTATGGSPSYTYLWSTIPAQTTRTATNLLAGDYEVTVTDSHGCTSVSSVTISGQLAQLSAIITSENTVNVQCYGQSTGSAAVTVTGGSPSYTYAWSTIPAQSTIAVSNLTAGNYTVTVTDTHGCSAVASVTINGQSAPLVAAFSNANVTSVACYGENSGSAMVTVTGGTPTYSYSWNTSPEQTAPTAHDLIAGNYAVTVTDNHGCTASASVEIPQYPLLEVSASGTGANCGALGGTVIASVSGGTGQYVYSWVNNSGQTYSGARLSNVMPGTYNLTVTDYNGCTATVATSVERFGTIAAHIDVVHAPGCGVNVNAGSIQAVAESGVAPFTYNWSASGATGMVASDLPAGAYYVTITDNWGCTANASINLEQFNDLAIQMRSTDATCFGVGNASATAVAVRGEPPYTYTWSNNASTETISGITAGRYTVTLTDANMCTVVGTVDIDQPEELLLESNVKPISCYGKNDGSIALNASGGLEPYTFTVHLDDVTYSGSYMAGLFPGTYIMDVSDANGCVSSNVIQLIEPEEFTSSYNVSMPSCFGNNDGSIEITASGGTRPYMYGWDSYYSDEPILTGLREGHYTISVVDANKCAYEVASIVLTDMAGACIKIPDVFTPNGDGINDEWIIENIDMFPEATVYVFNRWGQMLYKGTGNDEPWDGQYRGHFVPAGTYLYIVDLYQRTEAYKGTVTVIY